MIESEFLSATVASNVKQSSSLLHSGRTSLSVVIGLLEDLISGEDLAPEDLHDALNSSHNLRNILDQLETLGGSTSDQEAG